MDDLKKQIEELEKAWQKHHRDPKNNAMPNMIELVKLRIKLKHLITSGTSEK